MADDDRGTIYDLDIQNGDVIDRDSSAVITRANRTSEAAPVTIVQPLSSLSMGLSWPDTEWSQMARTQLTMSPSSSR